MFNYRYYPHFLIIWEKSLQCSIQNRIIMHPFPFFCVLFCLGEGEGALIFFTVSTSCPTYTLLQCKQYVLNYLVIL